MKKPQYNPTGMSRLLSKEALRDYLSLGRDKAEQIAEDAGAKIKVGRRTLYDREKIDAYIDSLGE